MLRGYWRFIVTAVVCLAISVAVWFGLSPQKPELPPHPDNKAQAADYRAGGGNCSPQVLAGLTGKPKASETDRCAEAAEQHRLQANDLIQQTRAADAAQSGARTAYDATRIALAGLVAGILTLIAAMAAAYYARRAFVHSSESFSLASRPFVFLEELKIKAMEGDGVYELSAQFRNCGTTPAINFDSSITYQLLAPGENPVEPSPEFIRLNNVPPNFIRKAYVLFQLTPEQVQAISRYEMVFWAHTRVRFDSRFRKDKIVSESRQATGNDFFNGVFFIAYGEASSAPLFEGSESDANDDTQHREA